MYTDLNLISNNQKIIRIGVDDDSPMTLFIKVDKDGFGGFGSIYFDNLSIIKMQKDFIDFLNCKINQFKINDTDSNDYYISMIRNKEFIEISGKIGNYTNFSLDFFVKFSEQEMIEKTKIIKLINQIKNS